MRTATPLLLTVGLVVSLAACAPGATDTASEGCLGAGEISRGISAPSDFGVKPEVEFSNPTSASGTERSVLIDGEGDAAADGSIVTLEYAFFNGETGDEVAASPWDGVGVQLAVGQTGIEGLDQIIICSTPGSRVAGVVPVDEGLGAEQNTQLGLGETDDLLVVVDIISIEAPPEPLVVEEWTENVPEIDFSGDIPVTTIPDADPPTSVVIDIIEEGDGDVVEEGATVELNYQGVNWETGEVFDQSYGGAPASFPTTGVIEGFGAALVGQKVGTTLVVGIPPEYAYGTDPAGHELGGQTLVFVIEILGVG